MKGVFRERVHDAETRRRGDTATKAAMRPKAP